MQWWVRNRASTSGARHWAPLARFIEAEAHQHRDQDRARDQEEEMDLHRPSQHESLVQGERMMGGE